MATTRPPRTAVATLAGCLVVALFAADAHAVRPGTWEDRADAPVRRNEASYVYVNGEFHLLGARKQHDVYDPTADTWSQEPPLPVRVKMVQAVALDGKIYMIGGIRRWKVPTVESGLVQIYDTATDTWSRGKALPRARGAGGTAVHKGKIFYVGGIKDGRAVPWVHVYDPATNRWRRLPDMPVGRDHFQAVVVRGSLYAIGGRRYAFNALVNRVDRYSIKQRKWRPKSLKKLPVPTAGYAVGRLGKWIVLFGGEGGGGVKPAVQGYNPKTNRWRRFKNMATPRHGFQGAKCDGGVYLATGSDKQGNHATAIHDVFFLGAPQPCVP